MKFLDVKTDYAFKRVFGATESVPLLISFLNAILDYTGEYEIVSLDILDPYLAPKLRLQQGSIELAEKQGMKNRRGKGTALMASLHLVMI